MYKYVTKGTCSREIQIAINPKGIIEEVEFKGGCNGNLQGLVKLALGKDAKEVMELLKGIKCQNDTSCPDQLSKAIKCCLEAQNML